MVIGMTKLALLAVLATTLLGACAAPYEPYHAYGYHHAYWRHHGYWRRGYWNNGVYVDNYIYVNPDGSLPAGVTVPQTDVNGNAIAPPNTTASGVAVQPTVAAPGTVQPQPVQPYPAQPNTASGVAP
jgi:hypothetical protein